MNIRRFNWPIWAGFLLSLIAFASYFFVFVWFPVTRDFPWANLLLFALAANHFAFRIRQEGERVAGFLTKIARFLRRVDADCHRTNPRLFELAQAILDAPKLGVA